MKKTILILALLTMACTSQIFSQTSARLLQYPDVSKSHITFSYGGDIWIVSKEGGIANKLTNAAGFEGLPKFSPDGSMIAFSGNYDGNTDIYLIPSMGGIAERLTFHGMGDRMVDWYPEGNHLLFASTRESGKQRFNQFFKLSINGGLPEKLTLPYAEFGSLSPDVKMVAFTPRTRVFRTWKRYRGGMAAEIWLFNLKSREAEKITKNDSNNELPMWHNDKIYFLSDQGAEQRHNIWCYNQKTKLTEQITFFKDFDIHFPSIGPDDMVFEAGGLLYLLNLSTEKYAEVKVDVVNDGSSLMPKSVNVKDMIQNFSVSHDGNRALFEARGEVFSVPAENGPVLNLTQSSGIAERFPSLSPNGKFAAFWSDESGEYELTLINMDMPNKKKKLSNYGPGFRYKIYWSPDSKKLAFIDKAMEIQIYDTQTEKTVKVDKQLFYYEGDLRNFSVSWSPDSRYLAYSKNMNRRTSAIAIYDYDMKKNHTVTSGFYNDFSPAFGPEGKYLYLLTNRNFDPIYSDFDNSWVYLNSTQIGVIPLTNDILSPIAPKNDTLSIVMEDKKKDEKEDDKNKDNKEKKIKIDFNNFEQRLEILPPEPGNYGNLNIVKGKIIYHKYPNSGSGEKNKAIKYFDLEKREEKNITEDADAFTVSANGEKLMVALKKSYYIIKTDADQKLEKKMPTDQLDMEIIPMEEWKQIFTDAWRLERDFFYDPNMHGLDWNKLKVQYGNLLKFAVTRWDVNFIIGELIAEISASHTYRGGGDTEKSLKKPVGYLGIDWGVKNGHYYVKKIIKGAPWDSETVSPLTKSGIKIKEGNYILAVNNVPLTIEVDPWAKFQGLAGKTVELTVNDKPDFNGAWKIVTETLKDETRLRNLAWIESNRQRVEEATDGRIGYIYVPSTGTDGQNELVRMFYAQFDKEGLIIDERFNNGGQIPDRFIELLDRKPLAFWAVRDGETWQWPPVANFGPKVMLINGWSGSGGDAFPDYFRKAGLGELIGARTWGGLIGITGAPQLIDGGMVTVPTFRMYDPDGNWFKEGHGVDPDIQVDEDMSQLSKGIDTQLEAAIETIMNKVKKNPYKNPAPPEYEKR